MNAKWIVVVFLSFFYCSQHLRAVVKGSETVVSIEPAYTFPAADSDNAMLGFGWFKNGFSLEDSTTSCTFNSVYPISGAIDMNGGTLHLMQDLILRDVILLNELGTIRGNGHTLDLCKIPNLPPQETILHSLKIELHQDLVITNTVMIQGDCELCCFGKIIKLQGNGKLIVGSGAHLTICDAELRGIVGENVRCLDDSGSITLDNVHWIQDDATQFTKGSILFKDHVQMIGSSTFAYSSVQTSTIGTSSCLYIDSGMHLCLGRTADTLQEPLAFEDSSSTLYLDNCSFLITSSGICLTKGTVTMAREVMIDALGTTTQTGLIIGDGTSENDLTVWFDPGAAATHNSGYWVYNNSRKDLLKSSSKTSRMIRNIGSKIYVPKDLELDDITVQLNSSLVSPIQVASTAVLSYKNAAVTLPDIDFDITSNQLNAYTYHLNGNDSLFLSKGILPLYLNISGTGNQIRGNGGLIGLINLLDSNAQLTLGINGYVDNMVLLNGGTCSLAYDVLFRRDTQFVGPGYVNLDKNRVNFSAGFSANTPIYWHGDKGEIGINGKVTLTQTWTIDGDCRIIGNNARLVLGQGGNIVLKEGAKLMFKNVPVAGLSGTNIRCIDDEGLIMLINSHLDLSGDYLFDRGSMKFSQDNSISGAYTFSYDSNRSSTINADASLTFKNFAKLAVGRKNGTDPLLFESDTSVLKFYNADLQVFETGIQLTKGRMILDGRVNLDMAGTTTSTGLIIGDGASADNDAQMVLSPAMAVSHNSGYWVYNNVLPNQIKSTSPAARLIRSGTSKVYLPKSLYVENFTVELTSLLINPVEVDPSALVSYSRAFVKMPTIEFDASCSQLNYYTYYLTGNNSIFITKGILPLYLLVQGTGNTLIGNGSLSGGIVFADSTSSLICGLGGFIDNFITLNGSTFILSDDLDLGSNATINGPGVINLGNNELSFAINTQNLSTPIYWIADDGGINVRGTVSLSSTWTIKGKCKINGINSKFLLGANAQIVVDSDSELIFENVRLYGLHDENIRCVDNTGKITLINADFVQTGDTVFSKGSMEMHLKNSLSGAYTFSYDSVMTSTIKSDGSCAMKDNITMVCGRNNGNEPFYLEDSSSAIKLQDCIFKIKETGMQITRGAIMADRDVVVDVMGTTSSTGLLFGDGIADHDMALIFNPGTTVRFPTGFVQYNITTANGIRSKTKTAQLIRGAGSHFELKQNLNLGDMTVDVDLYSQLTIQPGKWLSYSNGRIVLPQGIFDLTGVRYNEVTSLLNGDDKLVLVNGDMPLATLVMGTNNSIEGAGNITGPIIFGTSATELTCAFVGDIMANIALAGGKLILSSDLYFTNNILISSSGIVNMATSNVHLGKSNLNWASNIWWQGTAAAIEFNSNVSLQGTWTFSENVSIQGNNFALDLSDDKAEIVLQDNARLTLEGLRVKNLSGTKIRCLGDNSLLILDNVTLILDNDYSFTVGAIQYSRENKILGEHVFAYQTQMTSTLLQDSRLVLAQDITFKYDPISGSKDLFECVDESSELVLNRATLYATTMGMQLSKGRMLVENDASLQSEKSEDGLTDEGITLGDGLDALNDFHVEVRAGVTLNVQQGSLVLRNLDPGAISFINAVSTLHMYSFTSLKAYENISFVTGRVIFDDQSVLGIVPGNTFNAAISPLGSLYRLDLTP